MKWLRIIQGILLSFVFMALLGVLALGLQRFLAIPEQALTAGLSSGAQEIILNERQSINEPDIDGQAAIFVRTDFENRQVLFDKNGQRKLPIASISKLMTALVASENYDFAQQVRISAVAQASGGNEEPLKAGEVFFAGDLLRAMLIGSDNSAGRAFSELMGTDRFVGLMNKRAEELGLFDTSFGNPTGLGLDNFSTADDMAKLAEYLLKKHPLIFDITAMPEFDLYTADGKVFHKIINTNDLLREPFGFEERIIGGKTGETRQAGQCLLSVLNSEDNQSFLISVILNSKNRFEETKKIINWLEQ